MKSENFSLSIEQGIAHLVLNRPEQLNAMDKAFWRDLPKFVEHADSDGQAKVLVISSTGKHFSAGMDLAVFADPTSIPMQGDASRIAENLRRLVIQFQHSMSSLENARIPVLSAIHGGCIGGAVDLVCATDSRYCTQDAFFTIKETQIGMTADVGTLQRMPKLLPEGIVRELAYTGRNFAAREALQHGFVNQIFETQEQMLEHVMELAAQIAQNSPLAVSGSKHMLNYARDHSVADSLNYMATWQAGMFRPDDIKRTMQAQATKTLPEYPPLWPQKPLFED